MRAKIHLPAIINRSCGEISPYRRREASLRRSAARSPLVQTGPSMSHIEAARAYESLRRMNSAQLFNFIDFEA